MKAIRIQYILFVILFASVVVVGQNLRETRAVWVVTNFHLDWPPLNSSVEEMKNSLDEIFRNIRRKNFNTIYFQTIIKGSALYKSKILPPVPYFTSDEADTLLFDPLKYAVFTAHKYGLELHAWVNIARVFSGDETEFLDNPMHLTNTHPEWIEKIKHGDETSLWLNFGNPHARKFMLSALEELVKNYNVDGIQLDFIRYPAHEISDMPEYIAFGDTLNLYDWRRENINKFVDSLHNSLRKINRFLKIGATPFGIYKNLPDAEGSAAFYSVYQDSRLWLKKGWVDYLTPQIYWDIDHNPRFDTLAVDWVKHSYGKNIILGTAPYKKKVYVQLHRMINLSREIDASGIAFFRYGFIKKRNFPEFPTFVFPAKMPWLDSNTPAPPSNFIVDYDTLTNKILLSWGKTPSGNIKYYSLYGVENDSGYENRSLISLFSSNSNFAVYKIERPSKIKYQYELCSVSKLWNESKPAENKPFVILTRLDKMILKRDIIPTKPLLIKGENGLTLCRFVKNESRFKIVIRETDKSKSKFITLKKGINYVDITKGDKFKSVQLINMKTNESVKLKSQE